MAESNKSWYELVGCVIISFAAFRLYARGMEALGIILIVAFFAYGAYALYKIVTKKEGSQGVAIAIATIAIVAIIAGLAIDPDAKEEVQNNSVVMNTGLVVIHVENGNMFVSKDYVLYENGKVIDRFHLDPKNYKEITIKKTWAKVDRSEIYKYRIESTELADLIQHSEERTVQLYDGARITIDLST